MKLKDLLRLIEDLAPGRLATDWDNCGLMLGHPEAPVEKVAIALDATPALIQSAYDSGAQVLLTHHPILFRPLKRLNLSEAVPSALALAVKLDLALVAAHTNLDAARNGVSWSLARRLNLDDVEVLEPQPGTAQYKLVTFVPVGYEGRVRDALFAAGAGRIGRYTECAFTGRGEGTFAPDDAARPFVGRPNQPERIAENRLEVVLEARHLEAAQRALKAAHPYEEPAYDVYRLEAQPSGEGFGCIGKLIKKLNIRELANLVKKVLEVEVVRIAAPPDGSVERVAVMGGSGGGYIQLARSRDADVLITGDVGYHQAREAEQAGLCVIDAGHFATERPILADLASRLTEAARPNHPAVTFEVLTGEQDPWQIMEG